MATELQKFDGFNYSQLLRRIFNLVEFQFLKITCFGFVLPVLPSLSGFNFSLNSVICISAECFLVEFYLDLMLFQRLENMFFGIFDSLAFSEGSAL